MSGRMNIDYAAVTEPWHESRIRELTRERDDAREDAARVHRDFLAMVETAAQRARELDAFKARSEAVHSQWVNELLSNEAIDRAAREMEKPENDNGHDRAITCIQAAKRTATRLVLQGTGQPALEGSAMAQVEAELAKLRRERDEARAGAARLMSEREAARETTEGTEDDDEARDALADWLADFEASRDDPRSYGLQNVMAATGGPSAANVFCVRDMAEALYALAKRVK